MERYERDPSTGGPEAVRWMDGLVGAVHLPADDVVLAFVEGSDAESVSAAAAAAGWRVDRVMPATWMRHPCLPHDRT